VRRNACWGRASQLTIANGRKPFREPRVEAYVVRIGSELAQRPREPSLRAEVRNRE
jgi:hypothetical protein